MVLTELWLRKSCADGSKLCTEGEAMVTLRPRPDAGASIVLDDVGGAGRSLRRRLTACGCCGKKKLSVVAVEREEPVDLPESLR